MENYGEQSRTRLKRLSSSSMVNLALLWGLITRGKLEEKEPGKRESELDMSNRPKSRKRLLCL